MWMGRSCSTVNSCRQSVREVVKPRLMPLCQRQGAKGGRQTPATSEPTRRGASITTQTSPPPPKNKGLAVTFWAKRRKASSSTPGSVSLEGGATHVVLRGVPPLLHIHHVGVQHAVGQHRAAPPGPAGAPTGSLHPPAAAAGRREKEEEEEDAPLPAPPRAVAAPFSSPLLSPPSRQGQGSAAVPASGRPPAGRGLRGAGAAAPRGWGRWGAGGAACPEMAAARCLPPGVSSHVSPQPAASARPLKALRRC